MNHIAVGIGEVLWDMYLNRETIGETPEKSAYACLQYGSMPTITI